MFTPCCGKDVCTSLIWYKGSLIAPTSTEKYVPNIGQAYSDLNFDEVPSAPRSPIPAAHPADVGSMKKVEVNLESELLSQEHGPVKESNAQEDSPVKGELFPSAPPWKRARDEPRHEAKVQEESQEVDADFLKMAEDWSAEIWHKHNTRFRWWDPWLQEIVLVSTSKLKVDIVAIFSDTQRLGQTS